MPEFEIYPSNLRRHKKRTKKYKQTKVIEQNSPMFALKLDFLAFASIEGKSSKKPSIELKRQTDQETL